MHTSETTAEIAKALSSLQAVVEAPKRSRTATLQSARGGYSYRYAALEDVIAAIKPHLAAAGLAVSQEAHTTDGGVAVTTRLLHTSGEWLEAGPLVVPLSQQTPQAIGSAVTYARRYALAAILGIATEEDDDAELAERSAAPRKAPSAPSTPSAPSASSPTVAAITEVVTELGWSPSKALAFARRLGLGLTSPDWGRLTDTEAETLLQALQQELVEGTRS